MIAAAAGNRYGERMDTHQRPQVTIPDGLPPLTLEITDDVVGDGAEAVAGMQVSVDYVGVSWSTRTEFDASWNRGDTLTFTLGAGEVISGWDQGVAGMRVGGRRTITIPPHLAYGERGAGGVIAPNETLVFTVDLRSVG
jgi:peptidylprolyl isomerase